MSKETLPRYVWRKQSHVCHISDERGYSLCGMDFAYQDAGGWNPLRRSDQFPHGYFECRCCFHLEGR